MFIEQSVGRRRVVRMLFLVAAAVPCGALVGAAWWRQSAGHVAALEREATAHLGLPVAIDAVAHPRPGVVRLTGVVVGGTPGGEAFAVPEIEIEEAGGEVRLRVPRVECPPGGARLLAELADEWLSRPARFPRAWVVDVTDVTWLLPDGSRMPCVGGWHGECVAAGETRAVRVRREPPHAEEIRVRATAHELAVEGEVVDGLPVAIVAAAVGGAPSWAAAVGPRAIVRGRIDAARSAGGWTGSFAGALERVDLGGAGAIGRQIDGEATVEVSQVRFAANRLTGCTLGLAARDGIVAQTFLDGLVGSLECRPGPAYRALGGDSVRHFDSLGCRLTLDASGLRIRAADDSGGALIRHRGLSLVDAPGAAVPAARLAWLLTPAGRPAVPASPTTAWLISVLPDSEGAAGF